MLLPPRADLSAAEAAQRYIDNLAAIAQAALQPGPFIYGVYADEIRPLPLD